VKLLKILNRALTLDFKDFLTHPDISYTPEFVEAQDLEVSPAQLLVEVGEEEADQEIEDVRYTLDYEVKKLDELQQLLLSVVPSEPLPLSDESKKLLGKETITVSEYMAGLGSEEYGMIAAADDVEDLCLNARSSRPSLLYASIVEEMKSQLKTSISILNSELFRGFYKNVNTQSGVDRQASKPILDIIKADATEAQKLRAEILRAIRIYGAGIRRCVVRQILLGGPTALNERPKIYKLLHSLYALRRMMMYYTTLYAADWKSISHRLRNTLSNRFLHEALNRALLVYTKARIKLVNPVQEFLHDLYPLGYCPAWNAFTDAVLYSMLDLDRKYSDILADIYRYRRSSTKLQLDRAKRAPRALLLAKRWLPLLDAAIISIESALDTGAVDTDVIQRVLDVANEAKTQDVGHLGSNDIFMGMVNELNIHFSDEADATNLTPKQLPFTHDMTAAKKKPGLPTNYFSDTPLSLGEGPNETAANQ